MGDLDKPAAVVDGSSLVDRVVLAASFCDAVIVVGPPRANDSYAPAVTHTLEDPPFGGPVRALNAGLSASQPHSTVDDVVLVLSADLPYVTETQLRRLIATLDQDPTLDAVFATDTGGRVQYLVGAWRRGALERGVAAALEPYSASEQRGPSLREALPDNVATIALVGIDDVDTPDELEVVRRASGRPTVERARFLIGRRIAPLPPRLLPLADSLDGTLAGPVIAARPFPSFTTSAMDGYAVAGGGPWQIDDVVIVAGDIRSTALTDGHAMRIATGAAVPAGASVIRDEFVRVDGTSLLRLSESPVGDDARRIAEDWAAGAELAPADTAVTPAVVSAALSAGVTHASVRPAPTVRLVLTGDEIGDDPNPVDGRIRDTIGPVMPNYLRWSGFSVTDVVQCADSESAFDDAMTSTSDTAPDVVVVIGATGAGAADRLSDALRRARGRVVIDGLACRPGGSASVTVLPDGRVVLGVPGNPYAAVSTVCLLGPAIACALTGRPIPPAQTGTLTGDASDSDVARVVPASYVGDGAWTYASSFRTAHLAALIGRDGLALITPTWTDGAAVEIVPLPRR